MIGRANTFTFRIHHVEDHDLIFNQIVVKLQLAFLHELVSTRFGKYLCLILSREEICLNSRFLASAPVLRVRQQWDSQRSRAQRCYQTSPF